MIPTFTSLIGKEVYRSRNRVKDRRTQLNLGSAMTQEGPKCPKIGTKTTEKQKAELIRVRKGPSLFRSIVIPFMFGIIKQAQLP